MGTETICAPMTSFSFQPKPLALPYRSIIVAGAAAGVEWHDRHSGSVMRIGRDTDSIGPAGVSRTLVNSFSVALRWNSRDDVGFPVGRRDRPGWSD